MNVLEHRAVRLLEEELGAAVLRVTFEAPPCAMCGAPSPRGDACSAYCGEDLLLMREKMRRDP